MKFVSARSLRALLATAASAVVVVASMGPVTSTSASTQRVVGGMNIHFWYHPNLAAIAAVPGITAVRWDVPIASTSVASVVANFDAATAAGLKSDIVLTEACCNLDAIYSYVKALALAMGPSRIPIAVEILNEPNAVGYGQPWPAATFVKALGYANSGVKDSGLTNLAISMGGLGLNDQAYLKKAGLGDDGANRWMTKFGNVHLYTGPFPVDGGTVGPLSPDDPDSAHNGFYSFLKGVQQTQVATGGRPLIVGETGWETGVMNESQRASYFRAMVQVAQVNHVAYLFFEEHGSGDGAAADMSLPGAAQSLSAISQALTQQQ